MSPAKRARAASHSKPAPKKAAAKRTVAGKKKAAKTAANKTGARPVIAGITFRTPTRTIQFQVDPKKMAALDKMLQREAIRWTYVLRNRQRWAAIPESVANQAARAQRLLRELGLSEADLLAIATERAVEVSVPFEQEDRGWEARIFPWEFLIAGATRAARKGNALTVMRHLSVPRSSRAPGKPSRLLFVDSAPQRLRELFSFETEFKVCESALQPKQLKRLETPTLEELRAAIAQNRPDVIHLAGFDTHQGLRLLVRSSEREREGIPPSEEVGDGYLLAGPSGDPFGVDPETLASVLCSGGHRPELVSFSLQNSAARLAPMAIAKGAKAAIGFQDVFDDNLVELFFGTFYRAWRELGWEMADAFRQAWELIRRSPASLRGSGVVLWSSRHLLQPRTKTREAPRPELVWRPGDIPARDASQVISLRIRPWPELNYSLLHNNRSLFESFTLVNASAGHKKSKGRFAVIADVDVRVVLSAGLEMATFEARIALDGPSINLTDAIHLPLTSELMRTVHERINTSILVEVKWGEVLHRQSYMIRLLPVDQWRDNDKDGQWLPSFLLPRDPAVSSLVSKAQRYVQVLRDDPSAGFDGYQSVDRRNAARSKEVDLQVQAIWSTIVHELNLGYINPPPTYNTAMDSQRLRTPSMISAEQVGTCLDLAMLVAAACELIDVYPVIFLLNDHAFPGYWRHDSYHQRFIELADGVLEEVAEGRQSDAAATAPQSVSWWFRKEAYAEIMRQVKLDHLVPLESVWLTEHSGFLEAIDGGKENLNDQERFHSMLDIARAREAGVTPLPILVRP